MGISSDNLTTVREFLSSIGIPFVVVDWPLANTFIPGVRITKGVIEYERDSQATIGDILHEVGHLAIIPDIFRSRMDGDLDNCIAPIMDDWFDRHPNSFGITENPISRALMQSSDAEATAWSFAAACAMGIPTETLYDESAYDGDWHSMEIGLRLGAYLGINGLVAAGMTTRTNFPDMVRWTQNDLEMPAASFRP